jgi:cell division control protein 7
MKHKHASEEDDGSGDNTDASQDQADFEEEEEVDESVREDMKKLEDTFPGISDRFRLVNRIGEGMVALLPEQAAE